MLGAIGKSRETKGRPNPQPQHGRGNASSDDEDGDPTTHEETRKPVQPFIGVATDNPLPKYIKERLLGTGAYGEAWQCKSVQTGESIVIKIMNLPTMTPKELGYAQSEIQCLHTVKHTNIIRFIDSNTDQNCLCIAMELADAGDLRRHIKARKSAACAVTESEAMFLFVQIAMAVHHIHSRYMLHRDIKSANVLIMANGLIKLADFGFSRQYEDTVSSLVASTFCGTPYYLAPELWSNMRYSNKAEVWSIGVLLYELLAMERPFQAPSLSGLMEMIVSGQYKPIPAQYSLRMRHLVGTLLDVNPTARPTPLEIFQIPFVRYHFDMLKSLVQTNEQIPLEQRTNWLREAQMLDDLCAPFPPYSLRPDDPAVQGPVDPSAPPPETLPPQAPIEIESRHKVCNVNFTIRHEGPIFKLTSFPKTKWSPRTLILEDGKLSLVIAAGDMTATESKKKVLNIDDLVSTAPISAEAAKADHVFAVHTTDSKCTWIRAPDAESRNIWLLKIQQAMGVMQ